MSNYTAGRRAEYRTMRTLESIGYECTRSASSKGMWDVVAVNSTETRLIQVSTGDRDKHPSEIEPFMLLKTSPGTVKELWHWPKGSSNAIVKRLG